MMAALRVPRTTAWRALTELVKAGKIEAVGETKGRRYRVKVAVESAVAPTGHEVRWEQVLAIARREGRVTRQRVVEVLGVPERTAGRLLADLADESLLARCGSGRAARYTLVAGLASSAIP